MRTFWKNYFYKEHEPILTQDDKGCAVYKCLYVSPLEGAVLQHIINKREVFVLPDFRDHYTLVSRRAVANLYPNSL